MDVSVVIPLYNKGNHIERTIQTVLKQTYTNFEIIVVDDGSTDGGADKVRQIQDVRIRLISQHNQGVSVARNSGITHSINDFIAFLDADDEWEPDHLEVLVGLRNRFPAAALYSTALDYNMAQGARIPEIYHTIPPYPWEGIIPSFFRSCALGEQTLCSSSSVAVLKSVLSNEVGYFKEGVANQEDWDLWGRIAIRYPVAFSWRGKAIYHLDAENRACLRYVERGVVEEAPFISSACCAIDNGQVPQEKLSDLYAYIRRLQLITCASLLRQKRNKEARDLLKRVGRKEFLTKRYYLLFLLTFIPSRISFAMLRFKQDQWNVYVRAFRHFVLKYLK